MNDLLIFAAIVVVVVVAGVAVGMLVARPIGRLTKDDDPPDDD